MLKLKDIPNFIIKEIKSHKKLYDRLILKAFSQHLDLITLLQDQYHLSIADIGKHIQYGIEFSEHRCKTCGKIVHWNRESKDFAKFCGVKCMASNPEIVKRRMDIFKEKYGGNAPICSDEIKAKITNTNLTKYGVVNVLSSPDIRSKIEKTNLDRYGVVRPIENQEIKAKVQKHFHQTFGGASPFSSEEIREKSKKTLLQNYGVNNASKSTVIRDKIRKTNLEKYGVENASSSPEVRSRIEKTNLDKYGFKCSLQNPEIKDKAQKTLMEKYGVKNVMHIPEYIQRSSKCRLDEGFNLLIDKTIKDPNSKVIPLFNREDYLGSSYNIFYKWHCKECGRVFEAPYGNATIPICRECHPYIISSGQKEVIDYLKNLNPSLELKINDRTQISPYELDIYIPELKLAIEFNGDYWHSEDVGKTKDYHLMKTKLCEEKGIHLIHIFEHDWITKEQLIKQRLINLILIADKKIFARKCIVREIDFKIASDFISKYHLQGSCPSKVNLGLFYNNELISVMTFGKPRFNKKYKWELLRFCSSKPIIGAASKLLKYFERNYNPKSLISYANRCWSSKLSNVYEKIGFKLVGESKPSYSWVKNKEMILSRYQCQKHKLKDLLGEDNFDEHLSEAENMKKNGFKKVFDCGNLIFDKIYNED